MTYHLLLFIEHKGNYNFTRNTFIKNLHFSPYFIFSSSVKVNFPYNMATHTTELELGQISKQRSSWALMRHHSPAQQFLRFSAAATPRSLPLSMAAIIDTLESESLTI